MELATAAMLKALDADLAKPDDTAQLARWDSMVKTYQAGSRDQAAFGELQHTFVQVFLRKGSGNVLPRVTRDLRDLMARAQVIKAKVYVVNATIAIKSYHQHNDTRDDAPREAVAGFEINRHFDKLPAPNFVRTLAAFQTPFVVSERGAVPKDVKLERMYKHVVTEYVPAEHFHGFIRKRDKTIKPLADLMPLLLQVAFGGRIMFLACSATNYDLHGGNVLVGKIPGGKRVIPYPWGLVTAEHYATIIDYGRASVKVGDVTYGRIIPRQAVRGTASPYADIFFLLRRAFPRDMHVHGDIKQIFTFFGFSQPGDLYKDLDALHDREYDWDKFVELLFTLPTTQKCLTRHVIAPAPPLGPAATQPRAVVVAVDPPQEVTKKVKVYYELPEDPTYEELTRWFTEGKRVEQMRYKLFALVEVEGKRIHQVRQLQATAHVSVPSPLQTSFDMQRLRESDHVTFLGKIEKLVTLSPSIELQPVLKAIETYYRNRASTWYRLIATVIS